MGDESDSINRIEVCSFSGTEISLPLDLVEDPEIFSRVVSLDTWHNAITPENRKHLEKFLPVLPTDYPHAQEENLRALFSGQNYRFGNPVSNFHEKLKAGQFYPDIVKYKKLCQRAKYKEYKIQQQRYYRNVLKEILISRQEILDQVATQGPGDPIRISGKVQGRTTSWMEHKVSSRYKKILQEIGHDEEEGSMSSDDQDETTAMTPYGGISYPVAGFPMPPGIFMSPAFQAMMAGMPYGFPGAFPYPTPMHQHPAPPSQNVVTEPDYVKMMQRHRKRRGQNEVHPELDTRFTTIQEIVFRTCPTKKPPKPVMEVTKKKDKKAKVKRKLKQKLQQKQKKERPVQARGSAEKRASQQAASKITIHYFNRHKALEELEPLVTENWSYIFRASPLTGKQACFFSLLRELFEILPDHKGNLQKIEDHVKAWQASPSSASSGWSLSQTDWVKLVYSALIFLSGSSGETKEDFVPLVDFKERPQQWKWIGTARDSDKDLMFLCQEWLKVKEKLTIRKNPSEAASSSYAPVPRVTTSYVVRPSTDNERLEFRTQESMRYANPHKAFTFQMHGFESIVGPVKGVFSKDTNLNKAREHALLISNRPPYVTILTLVRDAAARLPNGEGTRAEVCELLKDSQFLNPTATDAQIHTVVSGALDRLHYEKDPCVRYDSNRKVWIYLHRSRCEEEFEKIHQASAAAARAKKMQKPRVPRQAKNKDLTQAVAQAPPVLSQAADPKPAGAVPPVELPMATANILPPVAEATSPAPPVVPPSVAVSMSPVYAGGTPDDPLDSNQSALSNTSAEQPTAAPLISRLNSPCSSTGSPVDLAGRKYTSALNSRTSALNTANMAAKAEGAGDESRDDSVASRGLSSSEDESTGASGTGTGSESGSGSSSDEEEEEEEEEEGGKEGGKEGAWRPQHGGKTVPDKLVGNFDETESHEDSSLLSREQTMEVDPGARDDTAEYEELGYGSSDGSGSDSEFSNID